MYCWQEERISEKTREKKSCLLPWSGMKCYDQCVNASVWCFAGVGGFGNFEAAFGSRSPGFLVDFAKIVHNIFLVRFWSCSTVTANLWTFKSCFQPIQFGPAELLSNNQWLKIEEMGFKALGNVNFKTLVHADSQACKPQNKISVQDGDLQEGEEQRKVCTTCHSIGLWGGWGNPPTPDPDTCANILKLLYKYYLS